MRILRIIPQYSYGMNHSFGTSSPGCPCSILTLYYPRVTPTAHPRLFSGHLLRDVRILYRYHCYSIILHGNITHNLDITLKTYSFADMRNFSQIYIMAVFGTKYRNGLIAPRWRDNLYAMIGQMMKRIDGVMPLCIGGYTDHIHILFSTNGKVSEDEIIRRIKIESAKWINTNRLTVGKFGWQDGSGRFSYSPSQLDDVIRYINNQPEHHRHTTFREEYEKWIKRAGLNIEDHTLPEELL